MLVAAVFFFVLTVSAEASVHGRSRRQSNFTTRPGPFRCPYPNGLFADPTTCRRFRTCNNYEPFVQNCPPGLFFDDIKKYCTFKREVTCGPVDYVTTPLSTLSPDDPQALRKCNPQACRLPDCLCSVDGTKIPGDLPPDQVPQMILLMFTGGVNLLNFAQYTSLLSRNRTNPNGCPISATFFMSHEYTNYHYVNKLYSDGHEIGVNSISRSKPETRWSQGSYENWTLEMVGMREILQRYALIPKEDILGMRSPFLKTGGNDQFDMVNDYGFLYDSSMAPPPTDIGIWPFTLEYKLPFKCRSDNCPVHTYPGLWEIPLTTMHTSDGLGGNCPILDQCVFPFADADTIHEWFMENFERHYRRNRAPLTLNLQSNWFMTEAAIKGLSKFIDEILTREDVWFVTGTQALQWIVDPTPMSNIKNFDPWKCDRQRTPACNLPKTCVLPFSAPGIIPDLRYMQTCVTHCPLKFPWLGNVKGEIKSTVDVYEPDVQREVADVPDYN